MAQVDPWKMVADYEQALQQATDQRIRDVLTEMRDLWIGLANERQLLTSAQFEAEVETLGRVHREWTASPAQSSLELIGRAIMR